jgi:hypothetical protein
VGIFTVESGDDLLTTNWNNMLNRCQWLYPDRSNVAELAETNLILEDKWLPNVGCRQSITNLCRFIRDSDLRLVIVDPLFAAMGDLAPMVKESGKVYPKLRHLSAAVADVGAALLSVHHTVVERMYRQRYDDPPDHEKVSYPVFLQWARTSIAIKYAAPFSADQGINQLLMGVHRKGRPGSRVYRLTIDHGPTYTHWRVMVEPWSQVVRDEQARRESRATARQLQQDTNVLAAIGAAMGDGLPGLSQNQIFNEGPYKVPGVGRGTVGQILARLCAHGSIRLLPGGEIYSVTAP